MTYLTADNLRKIVESISDGIYVVDRNGYTMLVNEAYEELSGLNRNILLGKHMEDLEKEGIIDESVSLLVLKKKEKVSIIQNIRDSIEVVVTGNPIFDEKGNIEMVVTSVRDVTRLNEITRKLEQAESILQMQNNRYTYTQEGLEQTVIFKSKQMNEIYQLLLQVAPYPTSLLLSGPTGSGKEVLANLVHNFSDRPDKPFIKVNCGAIPEQLLESEFFGYESGAFTGAKKEGKAGLFELASGGTIMLDEIGEMPLPLQVKLLRVLQEKKVQRIGSIKTRDIDIRIISATNQDLKQSVANKSFREDLYYRLAVLEIKIPSLSERKEDVEELIPYFLGHFCERYRLQKKLSDDAKEKLLSYQWPGNVRELRNTIENLVVSTTEKMIQVEHLPFSITTNGHSSSSLKEHLNIVEIKLIKEAIQTHSSIRKAAIQLGLHHTTLLNKMKKFGL